MLSDLTLIFLITLFFVHANIASKMDTQYTHWTKIISNSSQEFVPGKYKLKKLHFIWIVRSRSDFETNAHNLAEIQHQVCVHIFPNLRVLLVYVRLCVCVYCAPSS